MMHGDQKETEQWGSMREANPSLCKRREHVISFSIYGTIAAVARGNSISLGQDFSEVSFHSVYVSISHTKLKLNTYIGKENHIAPGPWIFSSLLLQWLVERYPSYSLSLKLTSGTDLTVSRPYRAIHPEVTPGGRLCQMMEAATNSQLKHCWTEPIPSVLRELQSSWHSLTITQGHHNRGYLFMNTCWNCVSTWL